MFIHTIDSKPHITTPDGIEIVDLTRSIFSVTAGSPVNYKIKQVTKNYTMRPDLISLSEYGTDMRMEWILKYTGISNPFSFNEDDLIMIPEQDTATSQMAEQPKMSDTLLTSLNSVAGMNLKPGDGALATGKTVTEFYGTGYGFLTGSVPVQEENNITPDDRPATGIGTYQNGAGLDSDSIGGITPDELGFTINLKSDSPLGETTDDFLLKTYYKYNGKNSRVPGTGSNLGGIENLKIDSAVIPSGLNTTPEIPYIASNGKTAIVIRNGRVYLGENTDLASASLNNNNIDQKIKDMLNSAVTDLSESNCLYNGMSVTSFIRAAQNSSDNTIL